MRCTTTPRAAVPGGFTLIELIVAITILSVLMGIVYTSFVSVTESAALARDNAETVRFRQYLVRDFTNNITSIFVDQSCERAEFQFIATDEDGTYGPADSLRFCTSLPMSGYTALPGVLRVVTYSLVDSYGDDEAGVLGEVSIDEVDEEAMAEMTLLIYEEPLVLGELEDSEADAAGFEESGREREIPVRSLDFQFYDNIEEEWVDGWDSTAEARLPWAVRIKVNFAVSEDELAGEQQAGFDLDEFPDLDMSLVIPLGAGVSEPFLDFNQQRESGLQEGEKI